MRERAAQILKIVCLGLAALLLVQLVKVALRSNPLANTTIPDVPSLAADTNAPPAAANKAPIKAGTNVAVVAMASNAPGAAMDTNAIVHRKPKSTESNVVPAIAAAEPAATNATNLQTNGTVAISSETNAVASPVSAKLSPSNAAPVALAAEMIATNSSPTNPAALADTNVALAKMVTGTNAGSASGKTNLTNSAVAKAAGARRSSAMPPQMAGGPMMAGGPGGKASKLPPEIQARVDRVTESEILAPIVRPMPMALLGIAGNVAFLRSPSGQTGLVKEGEDLGEIKLLHIGTNRVLVEQDGQPKELMIFSGLGGESLLPKPTVTSDETTKH